MNLIIDGWEEGGAVDARFTCDGDDISPAVAWNAVPPSAKSYVVALLDVDSPRGPFVHWLVFNIPGRINALPEWVDGLPEGAQYGTNDFGEAGYSGPCPQRGQSHRYMFEVYALDARITLSEGVAYRHVMKAIEGHVIDQSTVTAKFKREPARRRKTAASAEAAVHGN